MTTSKGGIRSLDPLFPRFAVGKTASKAVSIQSFGSADCLVICDEAPGVADVVHDSLIGTLAGGGCAVWLGNANRNRGFFHDAFSDEQFAKLTISSLESPNYIAGRTVVPGLAERGWVDSQIKRHGIESYFVRTNILGLFTDGVDESKPFSIDRIAESQIRWSTTPAEGRLFLGVDPSGTGADLTAISLLRGRKHMHMEASAALHGDLIVQRIISLLLRYRQPGEVPVVVIDAEGVGAPISKQLRAHAMRDPSSMKIVSVISSTKTPRYSTDPYDRTRDALIGSLERWMRDGGAIITDPQLEEELNFLEWSEAEIGGKLKITSKTKIKSELSRSPDKLDSLALACWVPRWLSSERAEPRKGSTPRNQAARQPQQQRGRAQINPYAGRR